METEQFFCNLDCHIYNNNWSSKIYKSVYRDKELTVRKTYYLTSSIYPYYKIYADIDLESAKISYKIDSNLLDHHVKFNIERKYDTFINLECVNTDPNYMANKIYEKFLDIVKDVDMVCKERFGAYITSKESTQQKKKPDYEVDENDSLYKFYDYNNKLIKQHGNLIEQSVRRKRAWLKIKPREEDMFRKLTTILQFMIYTVLVSVLSQLSFVLPLLLILLAGYFGVCCIIMCIDIINRDY